MNYQEILRPVTDLHVSKIEDSTLDEVMTISLNTWCVKSDISKGIDALVGDMLENDDFFENCLIIGDCFDQGKKVDIEDLLIEHDNSAQVIRVERYKRGEESKVLDIYLGDNLTVCVAPNIEEIEDVSLYDTVILLNVENSYSEIEDHSNRLQAQSQFIEHVLGEMQSGLFVSISNCITGIQSSLANRVDLFSALDVEDLGLPLPDSNDLITMRDVFNSVALPVENPYENQYQNHVAEIFDNQRVTTNRTAIGTMKEFGGYLKYDLRKGFPLMTSKFVDIFNVTRELKFFNKGMTNEHDLSEMGCNVWKDWAAEDGELGPVYGKMWNEWEDTRIVPDSDTQLLDFLEGEGYEYIGKMHNSDKLIYQRKINQLHDAIESLRNDPNDRRLVVTAFNPGYTPKNTRNANVKERLDILMGDEVADTAGNYEDEFEAEGHASSEEMAQSIVDEKYGEYENLTHERLDELGAPRFEVKMTPRENAEVGQQALPPCHMLFQLGSVPMSMDERIAEFARRNIGEDRFAANPVTCSNYNAIMTREHNNLIRAVERELGEECTEESFSEWLTAHGIPEHYIDLAFYQRSADMFRGVPYNSASYSLQLLAIAQKVGMVPRNVHHYLGDKHVYENHFENMSIMMERVPYAMPVVELKDFNEIGDFGEEHVVLKFYNHHGKLSAGKMAV
jgi:thymidylate synthase